MKNKGVYAWIKVGKEKILPTTASRMRINLMDAIELGAREYKTINGDTIIDFLVAIKVTYLKAA